ncbi:hypothetical protein EV426DRAFT_57291 [Tirmania nivea]|nr:hypothetical protein EV426DRAFT_57291 [Tirmania nivea]
MLFAFCRFLHLNLALMYWPGSMHCTYIFATCTTYATGVYTFPVGHFHYALTSSRSEEINLVLPNHFLIPYNRAETFLATANPSLP